MPTVENKSGDAIVNDNWDDVYDENGDCIYPEAIDTSEQPNDSKLTTKGSERIFNEVNEVYMFT